MRERQMWWASRTGDDTHKTGNSIESVERVRESKGENLRADRVRVRVRESKTSSINWW